jgi:hypothetical protein
LAGESAVIGLDIWFGFGLFVAPAAKEEKPAAADRPGLGAGKIRGRGNAAEEDEEIPERAERTFLVFAGHGVKTSAINLGHQRPLPLFDR